MWMEHALKAQKLTSNSKQQQLGAQKGTGETPSQVASVSTTNSLNAQKVATASREGVLRKAPAARTGESVAIEEHDETAFTGEYTGEYTGEGHEEEQGGNPVYENETG